MAVAKLTPTQLIKVHISHWFRSVFCYFGA